MSLMRDSVSAPIASTRFARPDATYASAIESAVMNPVQAELQSKAAAFFAPSFAWIRDEQAGTIWSGVTVPTTIRSRSSGRSFAAASARFPASYAMSDVASPSAAHRRSLIPVRWTIHSSDVSTIFSKYELGTTRAGTYEPVPAMPTRTRELIEWGCGRRGPARRPF